MRRVARTADERGKILRAYRRSGLSAREFAERFGVPLSTLYQWLAATRATPPVRLAQVVRAPTVSSAVLVVELERGRIEVPAGFDPATLATVFDLLAPRTDHTS
jgi:transposase